jgi:RNA polymerase-binding transcription factor DksA
VRIPEAELSERKVREVEEVPLSSPKGCETCGEPIPQKLLSANSETEACAKCRICAECAEPIMEARVLALNGKVDLCTQCQGRVERNGEFRRRSEIDIPEVIGRPGEGDKI